MPVRTHVRLFAAGALAAAAAAVPALGLAAPAGAAPESRACPPAALALGYSDALDKAVYDGATVGGLSDLAYDPQAHSYISTVDNHGTDPSRLWYIGNDLAHPKITRDPLVLTAPDGTPYTGATADNEGLAVLPDGRYLVSSETEPSIRIFGRDGVQQAQLPVPARFAVAPAGEATSNATLEGLTVSPSGRTVIAAMEGALSGDVSATGDARYHRFLVYTADGSGGYLLSKQIAYRAGAGQRVPEVAAYSDNNFVVEEAAFAPDTGNAVTLYAVHGLAQAADVSDVANLSAQPGLAVHKTLISDIAQCPTLGAPAKETQTNPLLDNFEGMAITSRDPKLHSYGIALISDDNFSVNQTTRLLNLSARLP